MSRLIIVANRLPVKITRVNGKITLERSDGGLATAVSSLDLKEQIWIGWPGNPSDDMTDDEKSYIRKELEKIHCIPVFLTEKEIAEFYEGYSNDTLWPLMHYFSSLAKHRAAYWGAYRAINLRYAEEVAAVADGNATIWIHDYHLMLLPQMIREKIPNAKIGFFLHIPFPSYEVFRLLPERRDIIEGLLGADLLGFHIYDYARHFIGSSTRILGALHEESVVEYRNRRTKVDVFPIGIDYKKFRKTLSSASVKRDILQLDARYRGQKLILSVDRLDYTKGILKRLQAFELFLEQHPEMHGKVTLLMIASPSRTGVEAYQDLRDEVERTVSKINGLYSTPSWSPISYQFQTLGFEALLALAARAEVALVTPMRDGMNLVAKEYVASKHGARLGVLILSEMAGAVDELSSALVVNPNDAVALAGAIYEALVMPRSEQRERLRAMQDRISDYTVQRWGIDFLEQLEVASSSRNLSYQRRITSEALSEMLKEYKTSASRLLLLDYDGTIQSFKRSPNAAFAKPGKRLKILLAKLAGHPKTKLFIMSGRQKDVLEKWFGDIPRLGIVAEHGAYIKDGSTWESQADTFDLSEVANLMKSFSLRTPGAYVEKKDYSVVWHYRNVNPELAYIRNGSLEHEMRPLLDEADLEIHYGHMIIEVKPRSVHKGNAASTLYEKYPAPFIFSAGDDYTDEEMFAQLPDTAYTVKVGPGKTRARFQVSRMEKILALLEELEKGN